MTYLSQIILFCSVPVAIYIALKVTHMVIAKMEKRWKKE